MCPRLLTMKASTWSLLVWTCASEGHEDQGCKTCSRQKLQNLLKMIPEETRGRWKGLPQVGMVGFWRTSILPGSKALHQMTSFQGQPGYPCVGQASHTTSALRVATGFV